MSLLVTFSKMMMILFAVSMGFLANKVGFLDADTNRRLTKLVLNITMPCMMLASVVTGDTLPERAVILSVLKVAAVYYGMEAVFMLVLPRFLCREKRQRGVWQFACMFGNITFIGVPVVEALLGKEAVFYIILLLLPFNILHYSVGPFMMGGKAKLNAKTFCTPVLISAVLSLILALARVPAPALLGDMLSLVGDITAPLSLLVLGSVLAGMQVKRVFAMPRLWIFAAFRLLIMPVTLLFLLRFMELDSVVRSVAVIEMAMPVAVSGTMLCMEYDGDFECMAQTVFVTTMLSLVTIPLVAALL